VTDGSDEKQLRVDLAAAFRLAAQEDLHESVANHFSVATSSDGRYFLINPLWRHFARISASDLVLLDSQEPSFVRGTVDATAWAVHGQMHAHVPHARCIMHLHPPFATALSCLADPELKPIDQNSAAFYQRIAITAYAGLAFDESEGLRLARALGDKRVLMMGNHGVLVVGDTVGETFSTLYYLERACRTLILAYSTGQKLKVLSHEIAKHTAESWEDGGRFGRAHFAECKRLLDEEDSSYAR
jgi:ribulose-5-phosphate 4-epimerase/fuculose-1-phosphate aldolase